MALREILIAPDPRLKIKAEPVGRVDASIRALMDDMLATMYAANGIGLAAPQVGVAKRVIVMDIAREKDDAPPRPMRIADPEIVWASAEKITGEEGCLSVPDHYADVERAAKVRVRFRDENDAVQELDCDGLLAVCIQHEMDHLTGTLFVDHISTLKRSMILRKLQKTKRLKAEA
jgi:peptide deformylase